MNIPRRVSLLFIIFLLFTVSVAAQKRRGTKAPTPARAQQPAPTLENLLAVDTYRIHVEIRGVGQLLKTPSFNDAIEPIMKLASPPKEFKTLLTWLNSQSDSLSGSRMMVASWSVRPNVPNVLIALEFASPEEAQKFEPRLQNFLPKLLPSPTPTPTATLTPTTPTSEPSPATNSQADKKPAVPQSADETVDAKPRETGPTFVIKQAGSLVYVSNVAFTFKSLRPTGTKLLTDDPSFRRIRDRFATEPVLVFVDSGGMQRENEELRRKMEEEDLKRAQTQTIDPQPNEGDEQQVTSIEQIVDEGPPPTEVPDPDVVPQVETNENRAEVELVNQNPPPPPNLAKMLVGRMASLIFSGPSIMPDAFGLALAFDPDTYALRLLLVEEPGVKANPIPFMPQLISGPPLTLEAAGVFPADTEFFISLSLDYQQIHDSMVKALSDQSQRFRMTTAAGEATAESPFAEYERKSGIKFKQDLFPLLGNEVALIVPLQTLDVGPNKPVAESTSVETEGPLSKMPNPIIAISIRDRDGVRAILPKVIESFGLKGASLLAQTEKRGDTEIVSYAGTFSYAFMGNFLILSTQPKEIRRVVDSYLNHDTLASESHFRNFTRWQPRQVLGQFYMSPKLMDSYRDFAFSMDPSVTNQLGEMFSRLSPTSEPLTYALSNEGLGPMHELRIPRNLALVMLTSMFGATGSSSSAVGNEAVAQGKLRMIASAENTFRATNKDGNYGSMDQLVSAGLIAKEFLEPSGYRIEVRASGSGFEATAVPVEYGKTGMRSFFIDESAILRGGDHGGGPATIADQPVQ